jgi:TetR/AcrR family tetracycline transcriptional repressor
MAEKRRKPGPRRALTEREILDAALALLDAGGPEAASVRRIAAAVGVAPNAVYTYFPDRSAVERALVDRLLSGVTVRGDAGWRAQVETLALDLRRLLVAHSGAVPLVLSGPADGPQALRIRECLLQLLAGGGLDVASAARGAYVLVVYVFGAIALEVAAVSQPGALPPEADRIEARRAALNEVSSEAFPHTAGVTGVVAGWVGTEQYLWGLRRVLDGLEAVAKLD